ncbi:MAG TPA: hypothetical protein VGY54_04725, partial [Polyangiaceae bacterium]|nr:hypothetical protein [Polyangiaceae bacterium]
MTLILRSTPLELPRVPTKSSLHACCVHIKVYKKLEVSRFLLRKHFSYSIKASPALGAVLGLGA